MMDVSKAQVLECGPDRGTSENEWTNDQIGGEALYHGFESAPPTGSRVTIDFSLVMVPAASSLSEGPKSGRCGHM